MSTMTPVRSSTSRAGGALEVARLARRDLVVDDDDRASLGVGLVALGVGAVVVVCVRLVRVFARPRARALCRPLGARLRLHLGRAGRDDPLAARSAPRAPSACPRPAPRRRERVAPLRHRPGDVEAQRVHEPAELGEIGRVVRVGHPGELHRHEHRAPACGARVGRRGAGGHGRSAGSTLFDRARGAQAGATRRASRRTLAVEREARPDPIVALSEGDIVGDLDTPPRLKGKGRVRPWAIGVGLGDRRPSSWDPSRP